LLPLDREEKIRPWVSAQQDMANDATLSFLLTQKWEIDSDAYTRDS
jgi:hypothetical protein